LPGNALTRLAERATLHRWESDALPTPDDLAELCQGAQGLICRSTDRIDAQLLDACPDLRVISTVGVGYDNFDVPALDARGVLAGNTPGVLTETTADLAFALILAASRRLKEGMDLVRSGGWKPTDTELLLGRDVYGASLGILGYGNIGRAVARRATGFAMKVQHFSRSGASDELSHWVPFDELLATSDIVSIHTPLTEATRGLIGARELARMKPTAVLVNTSRGAVVDQQALAEALRDRRIFAAGLDVTTVEPTPSGDPILALDNCIVLPHIGSASQATRARMADVAVDNVLAGLSGNPPKHCVNDPARFARRAFA
jgi:glyoxylate reductase